MNSRGSHWDSEFSTFPLGWLKVEEIFQSISYQTKKNENDFLFFVYKDIKFSNRNRGYIPKILDVTTLFY